MIYDSHGGLNLKNNKNKGSGLKIISELAPDTSNNSEKISNTINNRTILTTIIYPNPTDGSITIEFVGQIDRNIQISLLNSFGQPVYSNENITVNRIDIDISNLPKGIYVLIGTFGNNSISEKIILK